MINSVVGALLLLAYGAICFRLGSTKKEMDILDYLEALRKRIFSGKGWNQDSFLGQGIVLDDVKAVLKEVFRYFYEKEDS